MAYTSPVAANLTFDTNASNANWMLEKWDSLVRPFVPHSVKGVLYPLFLAAFFILFTAATRAGIIAAYFFLGNDRFLGIQQQVQIVCIFRFIGIQYNRIVPVVFFKNRFYLFYPFLGFDTHRCGILFSPQFGSLFTIKCFFHFFTIKVV